MKLSRTLVFVLVCVHVFWSCAGLSQALADNLNLPEDFSVSEHFSYFSLGTAPSIDWEVLHDPANNPILKACLVGTTAESVESLGIANLPQRLERLKQANLISQAGRQYRLAFPVIIGKKREQLTSITEHSASQLFPVAKKIVEQLTPMLEGHEEMLYHVLWSVVMDGHLTWHVAGQVLQQRVKNGDISFNDKGWFIYPRHRFSCGTNTHVVQPFQLRITHSRNMFRAVRLSASQDQTEFEQLVKRAARVTYQGQSITSDADKKALLKYGLMDHQGKPKIFVFRLGPDNFEAVRLYIGLSQQFAKNLVLKTDIEGISEILQVTPGIAFVVAYHEICYELLQRLAENRLLDIPGIVTEYGDVSEVYRLISLFEVPKEEQLEQIMNMIKGGPAKEKK